MKLPSLSLTLFLVIWQKKNASTRTIASAFTPAHISRHQKQPISYKVSEEELSPLPSTKSRNGRSKTDVGSQGTRRRVSFTKNGNKKNGNSTGWLGQELPKVIPRLSDVMSGITEKDFFAGAHDAASLSTPIENESSIPGKLINQNETNNTRTTQTKKRQTKPVSFKDPWKGRLGQEMLKGIPKVPVVTPLTTAQDLSGGIGTVTLKTNSQNESSIPVNPIKRKNMTNSIKPPTNQKRTINPNELMPVTKGEPWNASFAVSKSTQAELKAIEAKFFNSRQPLQKASAVLSHLLSTPPERCNEANVVCALTISAKSMTANTQVTEEFRSLLLQTIDILHHMVLQEKLATRQLCNAVWAVAKHVHRIENLLPPQPQKIPLSSERYRGVAESWTVYLDDESPEKRLDHTVDMIADQLTKRLTASAKKPPKLGEISMASWAYGILRQRRRPPGWDGPPQLGRLPQSEVTLALRRNNLLTFEQWATEEQVVRVEGTLDSAGCLFDAIGGYLCQEGVESENHGKLVLSDCSWSELANLAWAYASHGHCRTPASEKLLNSIAKETTWRLRLAQDRNIANILPRDIAQVVWSVGILQSDNFRLGDDLVALIDAIANRWLVEGNRESFQKWSNADLVQLAVSMAHARIDHQELLTAVYEESLRRVQFFDEAQGFHPWEISVLLWVQARLNLKHSQSQIFSDFTRDAPNWLLNKIRKVSSMDRVGIGSQERANLAWSLTVLEAYEVPSSVELLQRIFEEASASGRKSEFIQLEHAHQLWQALFVMEYEYPEAVKNVPIWFRDFLKEKWSIEKSRQKTSSARHRSLSQCLDLMGVAHYNEHDEDIDVAIVLKDNTAWTHKATRDDQGDTVLKVAVEFDGPNHFTREDTRGKPRALGHTVLKYRLLKRQGWAVVRVPYYEFDKIPFWASMERQRYLQRLLKTHANIRFSELDISEYKVIVPNRKSRFD